MTGLPPAKAAVTPPSISRNHSQRGIDGRTPRGIRASRATASTCVYRSRGAAFLRVATAITGDAAAAHDSVQEGFALAIRHRGRYRGDGPLEAWVWRLVVNAARSQHRRRAPVPTADTGDHPGPAPADVTELRALVAKLPERQRLAVFLRYYADLDYAAIGTASAFERERSARRSRRASGRRGAWPRRWTVSESIPARGAPGEAGARDRDGSEAWATSSGGPRRAVVEADATPGARAGAGRRRARGGNRSGGRARARHALLLRRGTHGAPRHPAGVRASILEPDTIEGVREITWLDPRAIRRVAHFSTPRGTSDVYVAPLTRPGSLCTLTVEGRTTVVDQWCNYPPAGRWYGVIAIAQIEPGVWTVAGRTPAGAPIGSVRVRFEDGTETAAAHGPGWFVFLVDPARLRSGHRPVGVDITRTDGTRLRRFDFFPGCIRQLPENVHGVITSCDGEP